MENPDQYIELIELTLAGDRVAYGELYEKTIASVYRAVHFLIEEKSDVEDVVQDIYIELYKSLRHFDISRPFRPWLMGIVMRQIQAYRRKKWMRIRITKKAEKHEYAIEYDFSNDVIDKVANSQLLTAIESLPYKLKQVVILHYLHEHSQEEIAIILNIPLGTVKSRTHAALKKLRQKHENKIGFFRKAENVHESR